MIHVEKIPDAPDRWHEAALAGASWGNAACASLTGLHRAALVIEGNLARLGYSSVAGFEAPLANLVPTLTRFDARLGYAHRRLERRAQFDRIVIKGE